MIGITILAFGAGLFGGFWIGFFIGVCLRDKNSKSEDKVEVTKE